MESVVNETISTTNLEGDEGFIIGQSINGKYNIEKQLGAGGMGLTYLASAADNIKRKVVIKTILRVLSNPEGKTAFLKEGEALGRINHDGVVRLFDKGEDTKTDLPFLVMEYVEGMSLSEIIERGQMDLQKTVEIIEKIAFALNAAHTESVLHRDLKPANIMIVESDIEGEKVKLIDFGVAKVADSVVGSDTTQLGGFKGTLQYASPEQLTGFQTISGETFNLAAITYEMLTQIRPFQITVERRKEENNQAYFGRCYEQIKKLQKAGAKNPQEYNPEIPYATAQAIMNGLADDLNNRYQTPIEFAKALKASLIDKQSDTETHPDITDKSRKSFWKTALLAAALLSLLAGGLLGMTYWNSLNQGESANSNAQALSPIIPQPAETLFSYSFEVQKTKNNLIDGKPFTTADKSQISFGDKFNMKIERQNSGRFYIIEQSGDTLNLIFPDGSRDAKSISGWRVSKPNQTFWLVWSKDDIALFEKKPINQAEANQFLQKNQSFLEAKGNSGETQVKGSGDLTVYKLSL